MYTITSHYTYDATPSLKTFYPFNSSFIIQSSKKLDTLSISNSTDATNAASNAHHLQLPEEENSREPPLSSRSSESGEINILDDFSEGEEEKADEEKSKPYAKDLEEAVALTMQVREELV